MEKNSGQAMIETLFVVVFTSIFMLIILQVCLMVINDMSANEAAFVSMRSAAVSENKNRNKEIKNRAENYFALIYPLGYLMKKGIVLTDKEKVERFFKRGRAQDGEAEMEIENDGQESDKSIKIWSEGKEMRDFSGRVLKKQTVKIYYYTNIIFGSLFANTQQGKRYQSARSRLFPSPDERFYHRAYPGAKKFE